MKEKRFLFVGNFLQDSRGSVGVSQNICNWIENEKGEKIQFVSTKENQLLRALDIIGKIFIKRPTIIYTDTYSGIAFLITVISIICGKLIGAKVVCVLHGGRLAEFHNENKRFVGFFLKQADELKSPSKFILNYFKGFDINVLYWPNPFKRENFPYGRDHIKKHALLWVRSFQETYNPKLAIDTLKQVLNNFEDATLTMVGPDKGKLREIIKYIKELKLEEKVKIVGPVENNNLYQYYQSHHVYINTTRYESFGMALLEAASSGIPIVSNSVGEIPYMWTNGVNIMLVDANPNEFAAKITELFKNDSLSNSMSLKAEELTKSYSWDEIKKAWFDILSIK
jgi:glycosyltransferase involved in cell wall biosynthesis